MIAGLLLVAGLALPPVGGAVNPAVTQQTIHRTVCRPGWTTKQRPPVEWSGPVKWRLYVANGRKGVLADYQLDHLIPLELGGCAKCLDNLWLQPIAEAHVKDRLEDARHRDVCSGSMTLDLARQLMREWGRR